MKDETKTFETQRYEVTHTDGTTETVCCGPRLAATPNVRAYRPVGTARADVCCHTGHTADLCRRQTERVRRAIGGYVVCEVCGNDWDTISPCALCNATRYTSRTGRI